MMAFLLIDCSIRILPCWSLLWEVRLFLQSVLWNARGKQTDLNRKKILQEMDYYVQILISEPVLHHTHVMALIWRTLFTLVQLIAATAYLCAECESIRLSQRQKQTQGVPWKLQQAQHLRSGGMRMFVEESLFHWYLHDAVEKVEETHQICSRIWNGRWPFIWIERYALGATLVIFSLKTSTGRSAITFRQQVHTHHDYKAELVLSYKFR